MNNFRLLVTKKLSPSLVLQAGLKGIEILEKEFIRIVPAVNDLNNKLSKLISTDNTVVFTSRNAVAAVATQNDATQIRWKIFCTEGATKNEVKKHFPQAIIAGSAKNATALAEEITISGDPKIIFFCGNKRLEDLPRLLNSRNIEVEEFIVYKTELVPQKIIDDYEGIAFFSPSAVESFFSENTLSKNIICFSVGKTTTEAIRKYTGNHVHTTEKPTEENVIEMAIRYTKH